MSGEITVGVSYVRNNAEVDINTNVKNKIMLHEIKMTGAQCDHCKKDWYDDHNGWSCMSDDSSMETVLMEEDWHKGDTDNNKGKDGEHYCPDCYSYDDEDNFILDSSRKDKYKAQSEY